MQILVQKMKLVFPFTKFGFSKIGVKKDWNKINNQYEDEMLYQLINHI